jgi:hypothetical protein
VSSLRKNLQAVHAKQAVYRNGSAVAEALYRRLITLADEKSTEPKAEFTPFWQP